jgi:hypothetical protein
MKVATLGCVAAVLLVAGCGSSKKPAASTASGGTSTSVPAKPAPKPASADEAVPSLIKRFGAAVASGDTATACGLTASRFSFKRGKIEDKCPKLLHALDKTATANFAVSRIKITSVEPGQGALADVKSPQGATYKYVLMQKHGKWTVRDVSF